MFAAFPVWYATLFQRVLFAVIPDAAGVDCSRVSFEFRQ